MFIVVSYDIPNDRRRTKVMKALKDFGRHVQYSVFECEIRREDFKRLRERLKPLLDPQQDNVRIYVLCQEDVRKRRVWGRERPGGTLKPWYIIGPEE